MTDLFVSYAQNYEDVYLWRALKHIERGCYIDVGAYDPTFHSATRAFYERGWRGVNLEPLQEAFLKMSLERPEDTNLNLALGSAEDAIRFYEVPGTGLSTSNYTNAMAAKEMGFSVNIREAPSTTLNKLWRDLSLKTVHFLKIDVEGSEAAVLAGLDLSMYRPWIVVVEATRPNSTEENFSSWEALLLRRGYSFVLFDGLNRYYVAKEHGNLIPKLAVPPNVFDSFVRASEFEAQQEAERLRQTLQALQGDNELLRGTLETIYQSRSWRYTSPLRLAGKTFASIVRRSFHAGDLIKSPRAAVQRVGRWALDSSALRQVGKKLLPWHIRWRIRRFLTASRRQKVVRLTGNWRNGGLVQNENRNEGSPRMFSIMECRQAIDVAELKARIHRRMECHKAE